MALEQQPALAGGAGMSGHLGQMMRLGQLDLSVLFSSDVVPDLSPEGGRGKEWRVLSISDARISRRNDLCSIVELLG